MHKTSPQPRSGQKHKTQPPTGLHHRHAFLSDAQYGVISEDFLAPRERYDRFNITHVRNQARAPIPDANPRSFPARELTLDAAQATRSSRNTRPLDRTQIKKLLDSRNERDVLDGLRRVLAVYLALSSRCLDLRVGSQTEN